MCPPGRLCRLPAEEGKVEHICELPRCLPDHVFPRLGTLSRSSSRRSDLLKELKARICQKNPGGRVCCARQLELPRLGQCGTSGAAFIVGGANTTSGEFPFTALLGSKAQCWSQSVHWLGHRLVFSCGSLLAHCCPYYTLSMAA